jgi:hypothetical protein
VFCDNRPINPLLPPVPALDLELFDNAVFRQFARRLDRSGLYDSPDGLSYGDKKVCCQCSRLFRASITGMFNVALFGYGKSRLQG